MQPPNDPTELVAKIERMLLAARKPVPVEEIRKAIDRPLEQTHDLLVEVGKRRPIRFVLIESDLAVMISDVFTQPGSKPGEE